MRGFWKLVVIETRLFFREPQAAFFTLAFPLMMLFIFGSIYGNAPSPFFGGLGTVDIIMPSYTALIIATTGLMGISISMAVYRESGILRRFQATPLKPLTLFSAEITVFFFMTFLGIVLLISGGEIVYGVRFTGNVLHVFAAFLLSCLSFFSLGFIVAGLVPTARTAQIIAMVLFFPMIFLSGATIPREALPEAIQQYGQILPLTQVVNLLRGMWIRESWAAHRQEVVVLASLMVVGIFVSSKTFRWE